MDVIFFDSPSALRQWLEENHGRAAEVWVGFYKEGVGQEGHYLR